MKKIIVMLMVSVLSLLVFGCTASQTTSPDGVDLPQPAGSDSALAGQGYAAGTYNHEYQLYNNLNSDGSVTSYMVDKGNWVYLGQFSATSPPVRNGDLSLELLSFSASSFELELETSCREYGITYDTNGGYTITSDDLTPSNLDQFTVPINRAQPIRQIAGTDDAITIHSTSSSVAWFTLHCDDAPSAIIGSTIQSGSNSQAFIPQYELINFYGNVPPSGSTGSSICSDLGYSSCVSALVRSEEKYFQSEDGSCMIMQDVDADNTWEECSISVSPIACIAITASDLTEPYYGDHSFSVFINGVVCQ